MYDYEFTLPIYGVIKQTKHNKNAAITLNWYCNAHRYTRNNAKKKFKQMMSEQINSFDAIGEGVKLSLHYEYYAKKNGTDLDNFVCIARKFFQDAMSELGFIPDDDTKVIIRNSESYAGVDKDNPRIVVKVNKIPT